MVDFSTSTSFNQSVNSQYNTSYVGLYDALSIPVLYLAYLPMESGQNQNQFQQMDRVLNKDISQ